MGKIYRNKKGSGCQICKPWKHGHSPKFKHKELVDRQESEQVIRGYVGRFKRIAGLGVPK